MSKKIKSVQILSGNRFEFKCISKYSVILCTYSALPKNLLPMKPPINPVTMPTPIGISSVV